MDRRISLSLLPPALLALLAGPAPAQSETDTAARDAAFARKMSGCAMVGTFTEDGSAEHPQPERYEIAKVEKVRDDRWRFEAKIEYGDKSATVPVLVDVVWAGDTPMIQVTDLPVPMFGTFTARVTIYGDRYAGMWDGADHGGHMFGRIERMDGAVSQGGDGTQGWANWRGPNGTGHVDAGAPPTTWSEDQNVRWKVALPGVGSSSPIIWGDRIYVTAAIETEEEGAPAADPEPAPRPRGGRRPPRGGRGPGGGGAPQRVHEFAVLAYDRHDGSLVWQTTVTKAVPHERGHDTGSNASNSPVTDGEHLFAHFGSRGVHCLDMAGEVIWSKDLGRMRTRNEFGEGSSPALYGDTLVVVWDHEGQSFIVAFDKRTGDERWRKERDEVTSWSTPIVVEVDGRPQVIVTATGASRGYDLETGEVIWSLSGMTTNAIPTPIHVDGVVFLMSGYRGSMLQAVRLAGARGDLLGSDRVLWSHGQNTSYVPSALHYDGQLYFLRGNSGVFTSLDAKTGEPRWEGERVGLRTVYSSPIGVNGFVYVSSREGVTKVFKAGPTLEEVATNELDDTIDATPAIVGDVLYVRGAKSLYCIGGD